MEKKPKLAIIDYGMGNLRSVLRGWQAAGAEAFLVRSPADIARADALVFPGQGAIADCMSLLVKTGFDHSIREWIAADRPFFGICLGLQALFAESEEGGGCACLGVLPGKVVRFRLSPGFKVPHMGWNSVSFRPDVEISKGMDGRQFYFVHSFYAAPADPALVWGRTEYGGVSFASAVARGRCHATQFHPEKSQSGGLQLYTRFLTLI